MQQRYQILLSQFDQMAKFAAYYDLLHNSQQYQDFGESLLQITRISFFNGIKTIPKTKEKAVWEFVILCADIRQEQQKPQLMERVQYVEKKYSKQPPLVKMDALLRLFLISGQFHNIFKYFDLQKVIELYYDPESFFFQEANRQTLHVSMRLLKGVEILVAEITDPNRKILLIDAFKIETNSIIYVEPKERQPDLLNIDQLQGNNVSVDNIEIQLEQKINDSKNDAIVAEIAQQQTLNDIASQNLQETADIQQQKNESQQCVNDTKVIECNLRIQLSINDDNEQITQKQQSDSNEDESEENYKQIEDIQNKSEFTNDVLNKIELDQNLTDSNQIEITSNQNKQNENSDITQNQEQNIKITQKNDKQQTFTNTVALSHPFFGYQSHETTLFTQKQIQPQLKNIVDIHFKYLGSVCGAETRFRGRTFKCAPIIDNKLVEFENYVFLDPDIPIVQEHVTLEPGCICFEYNGEIQQRKARLYDILLEEPQKRSTEQQLLAQADSCPGCGRLISDFQLCEYSGQLFCNECDIDRAAPPWAIIKSEFSRTINISRTFMRQIDKIYEQPLVLHETVVTNNCELRRAARLRRRLVIAVNNICLQIEAKYIKDAVLFRCIKTGQLVCKSIGYWSLCDFYETESGIVQTYLENLLISIERHIFECKICQKRNWQICKCGKVSSISGCDTVSCSNCGAVQHEKCLTGGYCYVCAKVVE